VAAEGQANSLFPQFNPNFVEYLHERWQGMARGRLGYAWGDKWLFYVTGGVVWSRLDVSSFDFTRPTTASQLERFDRTGWVAGWGTEYHVSHGWSVKWETLYTCYDDFLAFSTNRSDAFFVEKEVRDYHEWIFRVGMNYKFEWFAPVAAKF
jgi:opacity protein-like surface antigen